MNFDFTYQQDSLKESISLKSLNQVPRAGELKLKRSEPVSLEALPVRERVVAEPKKSSTGAAVNKPRKRQEQHLIVGNSRFIEPRNEVELVTSVAVREGLRLPQRPINHLSYDWMTLLLLVTLALFASVRTSWGKYMSGLFQSTVNYATASRMFQEKNNSFLQGAFQLDALFYLIFSAFIFQVLELLDFSAPYRHFYLYLVCLAAVLAYFFIKKSAYRFIGALIEKKAETVEFLYHADNFKRVAGLILIPLVAVVAFYPYSHKTLPVVAGTAIIVFVYSLLIFRGFMILLKKQFSIFYLFLYFCTLEFLPLVLLYKILVV